jgi:hypothetical protein
MKIYGLTKETTLKITASAIVGVYLSVLIAAFVPINSASAAIVHEQSISSNGASTSSVTTGTISGGTNQLYIVAVANRSNVGVSTVSGGSLTWTERVDACGGRGQQGLALWTATGSPSSFTVTVTLGSSSNGVAVTVTRYSGADQTTPVEDVVYENTNGETGACSGGTDGSSASVTTGSTAANSTHYVATNTRNRTISTADVDYTQRATDAGGSGGDLTTVYSHDYLKAATGDDTATHTLSSTADWITAGLVIKPEAAGTVSMTQAQYRWYNNNSALQPTEPNAAENSVGIRNSIAEVIRLRLGIEVSGSTLSASAKDFKLQYSTSTSGPWTDVGVDGISSWYDANWGFRKKITVDNTKVSGSGSHTDFPALVNLSDSDLSSEAQADGDDILFTSEDGTTKLSHEIESYTTGDLTSWVKIPSLSTSTDTDIYMYYGNSGAANQENPSGVWSNYSVVWHLQEDPSGTAPQVLDSTANNFDATTFGSMVSGDLVNGKFGKAYDFDGSNDYISKSDPAGDEFDILSSESITYSLWINSGDTLDFDVVYKGSTPGYRLIKRADGTLGCQFRDGTVNIIADSTANIENSTWRYIVCQFDGATDTAYIYVDGTQEDSTSGTFGAASNGDALELPTSGTSRVIEIDDFRLSKSVSSLDWVATEYDNQNSPSTFYTVGAEDPYPGTGNADWNYYDDGSITDGTTVSSTLLSASDTTESYVESSPSPTNPNAVTSGNQGEWDFAITAGQSVSVETVYYFRLVESDNTALGTYTVYPELCLDTVPATGNRLLHGSWFSNEQKQKYSLDNATVNGCGY